MKILVDENIPWMTVRALREMGHDVRDLRNTPLEGATDDALWALAQQEARLLVSTDKGFVLHRGERHYGILIVRLRQPNRQKIHERALWALRQFTEDEWAGLTVVVRDTVKSVLRARIE